MWKCSNAQCERVQMHNVQVFKYSMYKCSNTQCASVQIHNMQMYKYTMYNCSNTQCENVQIHNVKMYKYMICKYTLHIVQMYKYTSNLLQVQCSTYFPEMTWKDIFKILTQIHCSTSFFPICEVIFGRFFCSKDWTESQMLLFILCQKLCQSTSLISFFLHTTSLSICSENTSTAIHFFLSFFQGE